MGDRVEMGIRELRDILGKRVNAARYGGEPTIVTAHGDDAAALVPMSWYRAAQKWFEYEEAARGDDKQ